LVWRLLTLLMFDCGRESGTAICLGSAGLLPMPIPESNEGPSSNEGVGLGRNILMIVNRATMITIAECLCSDVRNWRVLEPPKDSR
jgi:hypothetical protein